MSFLLGRSIDATLVPGALSAIEQALGLGVGQQLVLIVEAGCEEIGGALLRVAVGAPPGHRRKNKQKQKQT